MIRVQTEDFNVGDEIERLRSGRHDVGAIVTFTGTVRATSDDNPIISMTLEHYPGMTERELSRIEKEAQSRWPLQECLIIHRYGTLSPGDNIVLVITLSAHRQAAFESAAFLMDYLKTNAPFWKTEKRKTGSEWVSAKDHDDEALARWNDKT